MSKRTIEEYDQQQQSKLLKRAAEEVDLDDDDEDIDEIMRDDDDLELEPMEGLDDEEEDPQGPQGAQEVGAEVVQAVARIPRQWQLSDDAMVVCLKSYVAWKLRLQSFISLPVGDVESMDAEVLETRRNELKYLATELLTIWSTGCSSSSVHARDGQNDDAAGDDAGGAGGAGSRADPIAIAYCLFFHRVVNVNLSPGAVDEAMEDLKDDVNELVSQHKRYMMVNNTIEDNSSMSKVNSVRLALQNAYRMLHHAASLTIAIDPTKSSIEPSKNVLYQIDNFNYFHERLNDSKPLLRVILTLIQVAAQRGYRRYRDGVYVQYFTEDGHATHFWQKVCSMHEFVMQATSIEHMQHDLVNMALGLGSRYAKMCEEYLMTMYHSEFPFINIDRHVFSFRNGIYFCATRTFRKYTDGAMNWAIDSDFKSREDVGRANLRRKKGMFAGPGPKNAVANYFDVDFIDYSEQIRANPGSWFDIPTPTLTKLLDDQEIPENAKKVVYGLIGRLFYEVGEMDDWQIILWLLGRANSGKSTICKIAQLFYQEEDVAVISNNIEEQFGLGKGALRAPLNPLFTGFQGKGYDYSRNLQVRSMTN
jgi:hypothetical protein